MKSQQAGWRESWRAGRLWQTATALFTYEDCCTPGFRGHPQIEEAASCRVGGLRLGNRRSRLRFFIPGLFSLSGPPSATFFPPSSFLNSFPPSSLLFLSSPPSLLIKSIYWLLVTCQGYFYVVQIQRWPNQRNSYPDGTALNLWHTWDVREPGRKVRRRGGAACSGRFWCRWWEVARYSLGFKGKACRLADG